MSRIDDNSRRMKVVVIGGANVGKTSIISAYVSGITSDPPAQTVQLAFSQKDETIGETVIHLQICDTAGQERFQSVCPNFYRDAQGALVVFDVTSLTSFQRIHEWIDELNATMPDSFLVIVIGNKTDLIQSRVVTREKALEFTNANEVSYLETSAVTGHGIQAAFQLLCEKFLETEKPKTAMFVPNPVLDLTEERAAPPKEACCA
jgi:small GTP-binding protein